MFPIVIQQLFFLTFGSNYKLIIQLGHENLSEIFGFAFKEFSHAAEQIFSENCQQISVTLRDPSWSDTLSFDMRLIVEDEKVTAKIFVHHQHQM